MQHVEKTYESENGGCNPNGCNSCFNWLGYCPVKNPRKVLWISRHKMTDTQVEDLEYFYERVEIFQVSKTFSDVKEIIEIVKEINPDVLAVVLPDDLIEQVLNSTNVSVIRSVNGRISTGWKEINPSNGQLEDVYTFSHVKWEKVISCNIVTQELKPFPFSPQNGKRYALILYKRWKEYVLCPHTGQRVPKNPENIQKFAIVGRVAALEFQVKWINEGQKYRPLFLESLD